MQEAPAKSSPVIPILIALIVILLIAICLVGGYLIGKGKSNDKGNDNMIASVAETTASPETAPPVTEAAVTEPVVTEPVTEKPAETTAAPTTAEPPTTVQTSVVVSVQVVTEAAKTIFVGDYVCDVRVATKQTDLNMRESPSTSAKIIGSIPKDTIVAYYGAAEGSWGIVFYNGKYGYVNTAYISYDLYPSGQHRGDYGGSTSYAVVNANGGLNLRAAESTSSTIITTIPNGTEIPVYSSYDGWSYVSWNGNYGYVKSEYIKFK